jgi:hypothetical protein
VLPVKFIIRSNYKSFKGFMVHKIDPNIARGSLFKWQQKITRYDFTAKRIAGIKNFLVDSHLKTLQVMYAL